MHISNDIVISQLDQFGFSIINIILLITTSECPFIN